MRRLTAPQPQPEQDAGVAGIPPAPQEREMIKRMWTAALVVIMGMAACEAKRDADDNDVGTRRSADTVVTEREMRDTTIVRTDTTITKDTVRKRGTRPVDSDTIND